MRKITKFETQVKLKLIKKRTTMTNLAQQLGISIAYCSDIVRGNRNAQHIRKKICEILNIEQGEK